MQFGLTRQEASIYQCLLSEGKISGYEVAKQTGISRSNAYGSLASMTEKGAAYLVEEGTTKKYVAVPLREFCKNYIRGLEESRRWLEKYMPSEKAYTPGYITIEGRSNILNKVRNMLSGAQQRVYLSCTRNHILLFVRELEELLEAGKKVVIVTDFAAEFGNAKVYTSGENKGNQIGVIVDSSLVLTGEYGEGSMNSCLYSGKENFVELYKNALANEIKLLELWEEKVNE